MISFFYKNSGAGEIRGHQMGEYLGAKLNPSEGYEDDVCIYVKMVPPKTFPKKSYLDIVDGAGLVSWLIQHPNCGAITPSRTGQILLTQYLTQKPIFIPENHCNYEQYTREERPVTTVGIIGNLKGFNMPMKDVSKRLMEHGLFLQYCDTYQNRLDVVSFYKTIDIQICWRPHVRGIHAQLHNPLKLANAGSFGIPTVAFPEDNFLAEFDGCFYPAYTIDDLFNAVDEISKDERFYGFLVKKGLERAREYHIEKVAELYRELEEE